VLTEWMGIALPLLCAPLMLFPRARWMWVIVIIPLSWLPRLMAKGRLLEPTPLNVLLLFLILMVGVSLYATFDLEFSMGKVAGLLLGLFIYWGIAQFANSERRLNWLLAFFLIAGMGVALVGLVGTDWRLKYPAVNRFDEWFPLRLKGLPGAEKGISSTALGGVLILFMPLAATLAAYFMPRKNRPHGRQSFAYGSLLVLLAVMSGTLLLSQARGAWLALAAAMALILMLKFRWTRWAFLVMMMAGGLLAIIYRPWTWENMHLSPNKMPPSAREINIGARLEFWSRAINGIQDFPITGMGMNAFRRLVRIRYPQLNTVESDLDVAHCHNQLLQAALDLGIPGMVAYAAIWAAVFRMLWRVWRNAQDFFHRALALGLGGGLLAQFVFGINDAIALGAKAGIFWWIVLALAVSLDKLQKQVRDKAAGSESKSPKAWEAPLLWVLISLLSISLVGNHPYISLAVAILGGTCLGLEMVKKQNREDLKDLKERETEML